MDKAYLFFYQDINLSCLKIPEFNSFLHKFFSFETTFLKNIMLVKVLFFFKYIP